MSSVTKRYVMSAVALCILSACAEPSNPDGRKSTFVTVVDPSDREMLPALGGHDLDGAKLSTADYAGKILVLNLWGQWCAPCRAETPVLKKVSADYASRNVQFLGIVNDSTDTVARSFNRNEGITYPSFSDQGGYLELAFNDTLPTQAVPTTWVIDAQGRVAARIIDQDLSAATLSAVIDDVLDEG